MIPHGVTPLSGRRGPFKRSSDDLTTDRGGAIRVMPSPYHPTLGINVPISNALFVVRGKLGILMKALVKCLKLPVDLKPAKI